jgi:hypothetical protein
MKSILEKSFVVHLKRGTCPIKALLSFARIQFYAFRIYNYNAGVVVNYLEHFSKFIEE